MITEPTFEIKENDLQLVVSEKTLGHLLTNAEQIKAIVKQGIKNYDIANYDEDNVAFAKKDKALLNSAAKQLNDERIRLEREFMQPFQSVKDTLCETVQMIKDASAKIDTVVKGVANKAKQKKYDLILTYFLEKQFILVEFEKIYKPEWLNKTYKIGDVKKEIDYKIKSILEDIDYIENCSLDIEDRDWVKADYLKTLDRKLSFENHKTFSENQYLLRVAEAEEAKPFITGKTENGGVFQAFTLPPEPEVIEASFEKEPPEILTRIFKVETTRENLIALSDFMNERGIVFEKIENGGR